MREPFLSIIIPAYNAERYIRECIESVINQSFDDWEIIIINDGSIDKTEVICNEYAKLDNRIRLFNRNNSGVSESRNFGILQAKGKWITFLDADDAFQPNIISIFTQEACECDVIVGQDRSTLLDNVNFDQNYNIISAKQAQLSILNYSKMKKYFGNKAFFTSTNNWSSWSKFYKREIVINSQVKFNSKLKLSEDLVFCFDLYNYINNIYITTRPVYFYRPNPSSVTRNFCTYRIENTKMLANVLSKSINKVPDIIDEYHKFVVNRIINCCFEYYCHRDNSNENKTKIKELKELCSIPEIANSIKINDYRDIYYGIRNKIAYTIILFLLKLKMYNLAIVIGHVLKKLVLY